MARLNLGLSGLSWYNGLFPILNLWKTARYPTLARTAGGSLDGSAVWSTGGYLDEDTGEIVDPAPSDLVSIQRIFFAAPAAAQVTLGADFAGEQFVAEWDGSATASFVGAGTGASQSNDGSNKRILTLGSDSGSCGLLLTLTDVNDPPRNVRIYQTRYASEVAAGEMFNPDWLEQISGFRRHRYMDWMGTNGSAMEDIADLATEAWHVWGTSDAASYGPKTGIPLPVIIELANTTGVPPWVTIPHLASDELVEHIAETMKAGTSLKVRFEYTNEPWNSTFSQYTWLRTEGDAIWSGDSQRQMKFYGRRAAQISKIIRDVYGDTSRWEMALNVQTNVTATTDAAIAGLDYWISENSSSLGRSDIAQMIAVTGYFGDVQTTTPITSVSKANPAVLTRASHGLSNGTQRRLFVSAGMTELNDTVVTVANATTDTFELSGVDSTGYTTWASGNNYMVDNTIFALMAESESLNGSDPATYPTKYTYFNQQIADSMRTGTCDFGFASSTNVATARDTRWPAQKAIADANGMLLVQYEGGCHFVGGTGLSGFGGQAQFTEFLFASSHSEEVAEVLADMYQRWVELVGNEAAKFVEAGADNSSGTWGGFRFLPLAANEDTGDTDNPVWQATLRANAGKRTITLT